MPATTVETLIYKLEVEDKASKVFADAAKEILNVDKALKSLEGALTGGFSGIFASIGKTAVNAFKNMASASADFVIDSIKNFANYEDILTHAARTLNLTKEEAKDLGMALTEMSTGALAGGATAEELAKIAGVAGQLGVAKEDVLGFTEVVAQMSAAFGISAEKSAEGMAIVLNVFKLSQDEMVGVGSAIAELGNATAASADQIINIMQRMGAVAEFMGLTAEQTSAIAATLRDVGVSVNVAGSSMSQILARIMSEYSKFAEVLGLDSEMLKQALESNDPSQALFMVLEALNQINATGGKIAATEALKDLGLTGVRTQNTMLLLSGSVNELRANMALANQASEEGTSLQDLYNISIDTAKGRWKAFQEAISTVQKIIGGPLAEAFSKFLDDYITPVINKFGEWLKQSPFIAKVFEELLPSALNKLGETVTNLWAAFADFLFGLDHDSQNVISNLIGQFKEWGSMAWNQISQAATAIVTFVSDVERLSTWFQNAKRTGEDLWNTIKFFFEGLNQDIQGIFMVFTDIIVEIQHWNQQTQVLQTAWKLFSESIGQVLEYTLQGIAKIGQTIGSALIDPVEAAKKAWSALGDVIYGNSVLPDTIEWTEKASEALFGMQDSVDAVGRSFVEMGQTAYEAVKATMDTTAQSLAAIGGFGGMSQEQLMDLRGGSILNASGRIGSIRAMRDNQENGMPQINTQMPMIQQGMPNTITNVVKLGDEEIGVITNAINNQNQQNDRRATGTQR